MCILFFVGMVVCFLEFGVLGLGCFAIVLAQSQSNVGSLFVHATGMTELQVVLVQGPMLFRSPKPQAPILTMICTLPSTLLCFEP